MTPALTLVDLFCGAGGLSLGFHQAGFQIIAAFDNWQPAVDTYRANFADHVHQLDITTELGLPHADVIVGGPPCQGFSSAGMRRDQDRRNSLASVFAHLVARSEPRAFVFENVEGFLTGARGQFVFDLLTPLIRAGYQIHLCKLNAADFGVPQHRKRVIAFGGLGWNPSFPQPTHSAYGAPGAQLGNAHLPPTPSVTEALQGLPAPVPDGHPTPVPSHTFVPLGPDHLERAKLLKPGQRMRDLPEQLWHPSYRRRAFRRVMDGTPTERRGGAPAGLRRLRPDHPSKAITGGALTEFLHPDANRPLTIRECARLQTFPDHFLFPAPRRDTIQLIGNAVPPLLGERLAACLAEDLRATRPQSPQGALLTFIPTLANGTSPILKHVIERVRAAYGPADHSGQMSFQWPSQRHSS